MKSFTAFALEGFPLIDRGDDLGMIIVETARENGLRLEDGDVIVGWDGEPVASIDALHRKLSEQSVGTSAEITVIRRSQKLTRRLRPAELSER